MSCVEMIQTSDCFAVPTEDDYDGDMMLILRA